MSVMHAPARRHGLGLGLVVLALSVVGCTGQAGHDGATAAEGTPASSEAGLAPEFTLTNLDGSPVRLADSTGQVRLIDFWATWCAPCREEIPMLNELQSSYGDKGFQVLAISDEDPSVIREFVEEHGVRYTNLVGTEAVAEAYGVLGLPAAYLLDGEGKIVKTFLGPKPRRVLSEKIEALLTTEPAT